MILSARATVWCLGLLLSVVPATAGLLLSPLPAPTIAATPSHDATNSAQSARQSGGTGFSARVVGTATVPAGGDLLAIAGSMGGHAGREAIHTAGGWAAAAYRCHWGDQLGAIRWRVSGVACRLGDLRVGGPRGWWG